ncbi:cardiolipin synthase [Oceanobacillus caeni]|uniref:Cardiolipin synthase n=1 Tax=Oceanobacillus caeni TaxID=405946 RepID=A0ABR5MFJ2_9BACI|nr:MULTISPECIES: hypothetical protein [Bacillaceae]KPH70545.1 hypothetical protein AFL42_16675 [Oceanobacillus caeni]MCR1836274.1 cardiolipin synthase [Oceanobacillus caeni]MED4475373.1 cardiolipin synthase [Oceanobacillus caeni]
MSKIKKISILVASIVFVGILSFSFYNNVNEAQDNQEEKGPENNNSQDQTILASKDFSSTSSLDDMVYNSDFIAVGSYESLDEIWNMAADPENEDEYVEGHLYNFSVSEVFKGENMNSIKINHRYSENIPVEITSGDEEISPEGILIKEATTTENFVVENKDPLFIEPDFSKKYIVFLKKGDTGNYYAAIEPYLIEFDENEVAVLKSNLLNLDEQDLSIVTEIDGHEIVIHNDIHQNIDDNISGKEYSEIKESIISLIN